MGYNYFSHRCLLLKPAREGQRLQQQEHQQQRPLNKVREEVFVDSGVFLGEIILDNFRQGSTSGYTWDRHR